MKFIAEIGSNHNRDVDRTMKLIEAAKEIGCQAVKFQRFDLRLSRDNGTRSILASRMLPSEFVSRIFHKCRDLKIDFHCSIFHPDFAKEMDCYVSEFKIGSYEILWLDLIEACAKTHKNLAISTGGATMQEITGAYYVARKYLPPELITLYHCDPNYPASPFKTALYEIPELRYVFPQSFIGYSDHTVDTETMFDAIQAGAQEIEFHLDLDDMKGYESIHGHCWSVSNAKKMVDDLSTKTKSVEARFEEMRLQRCDPRMGSRPMLEM